MAKLDENYLGAIRQTLFNSETYSVKNGETKNSEKIDNMNWRVKKSDKTNKDVSFVSETKPGKPTNNQNIKNRVCTPFKANTLDAEFGSTREDNSEHEDIFETKQGIKCKLFSDRKPGLGAKKKKVNISKTKLNLVNAQEKTSKNKKKNSVERELSVQLIQGDFSPSLSNTLFGFEPSKVHKNVSGKVKSKKIKQVPKMPQSQVDRVLCDFQDDPDLVVEGFRFQRFCNLFPTSHTEHMTLFEIPQKYFHVNVDTDYDVDLDEDKDSEHSTVEKNAKEDYLLHNTEFENGVDDVEVTHDSPINQNKTHQPSVKVLSLNQLTKVIVLESPNEEIHFHGLCSLEVLHGKVEILGTVLTKSSGIRNVYSPRGSALLYMRNKAILSVDNILPLRKIIPQGPDMNFRQHCSIVKCTHFTEPYIDFIETHISQKIFPDSSTLLKFECDPTGSFNKMRTSEQWEQAIDMIAEDSRAIICGGKGVGKSTFLRYTVNVLLGKFKEVRVIDLDPGQSEFFPPGGIGVTTITQELLGPNYTHLHKGDLLVSHINVGYNITSYLNSLKILVELLESKPVMPTLINFPGYTQGLGLDIGAHAIEIMSPTLVIEIKSNQHNKNYRVNMTAENVTNIVTKSHLVAENLNSLYYVHMTLDSLSERTEAWTLEARHCREICMLSYFGKCFSDAEGSITSCSFMYSKKLSEVTLTNFEGKSIPAQAVNANLVTLCSVNPRALDVYNCHGYGLVRGIDLEEDILVLVTPESGETLDKTTHLVLGSVNIPPSLIMSQKGLWGSIPYVSKGELIDFAQFTKRSYLPPKK